MYLLCQSSFIPFQVKGLADVLRQQFFEPFGYGIHSTVMDKIHGGLSVHVLSGRNGSMDDVAQIGIGVVDIDIAGDFTGFDKVPLSFRQPGLQGILLQYNQVAAYFRTRIDKQIVRQADSRNKVGMVHQSLSDGTVPGGVHDTRSGDVGQYTSFTQGIHSFEEEIIMYGCER